MRKIPRAAAHSSEAEILSHKLFEKVLHSLFSPLWGYLPTILVGSIIIREFCNVKEKTGKISQKNHIPQQKLNPPRFFYK